MKKIIMFIVTFIIGINVLNADCSDYEEIAKDISYNVLSYFNTEDVNTRIDVNNLPSDMYLEVRNSFNSDKDIYKYEDTDSGNFFFYTKTVHRKINYEIRVYTTDASCPNKVLRTIKFTTPKYNPHITSDLCVGYYDKVKYCDAFYDIKDMDLDKFNKLVSEEISKIKVENMTTLDYIKKYYLFALIPFLIISGIYITKIVLVKRRKKKYV